MFHFVWVGSLEGAFFPSSLGCCFGGAACLILFGLVAWRDRLCHLVGVGGLEGAGLEGPFVSFCLGW